VVSQDERAKLTLTIAETRIYVQTVARASTELTRTLVHVLRNSLVNFAVKMWTSVPRDQQFARMEPHASTLMVPTRASASTVGLVTIVAKISTIAQRPRALMERRVTIALRPFIVNVRPVRQACCVTWTTRVLRILVTPALFATHHPSMELTSVRVLPVTRESIVPTTSTNALVTVPHANMEALASTLRVRLDAIVLSGSRVHDAKSTSTNATQIRVETTALVLTNTEATSASVCLVTLVVNVKWMLMSALRRRVSILVSALISSTPIDAFVHKGSKAPDAKSTKTTAPQIRAPTEARASIRLRRSPVSVHPDSREARAKSTSTTVFRLLVIMVIALMPSIRLHVSAILATQVCCVNRKSTSAFRIRVTTVARASTT